ncbi:tumor necrosis factor receptor superfamily member 25 [Pelobates cultripes]|uniref:Tumor necrosis factor receptor superfamily member 25 n=1 Tax=Pelobates cultripes TaxID=61616 RepID=A0AAD1WS06_PELCU|nr:tumor necrosis factor receptor superfamily member 25 [Pelobates cultripes]
MLAGSQNEDAQCGDCLPGFYESENICLPCPQDLCSRATSPINYILRSCSVMCKSVSMSRHYQIKICDKERDNVVLYGFNVYHKKKKTESLGNHGFTLAYDRLPQSAGLHILPEMSEITAIQDCQPASILHKGSALYDIIDSVPVRRWKEFMRVLELPDKEIELVEVEIASFRDQQYEMLRRLGHLRSTSLEHVFNALERMNLSGCAEELREKLESHA